MTPQRLIKPQWYRDHGALIGYIILCIAVAYSITGVKQNAHDSARATRQTAVALAQATRDNAQRLAHQSCVSAKDTRQPLLDYLESTLQLNDKVREAHLLPPAPPALRKLQHESLQNLRTLTRVFREKQRAPCPPLP